MKISLSWLKEWIDLDHSPQEIAVMLTQAGLEVDAIESHAPSFNGVIAGKVLSVEKHPDADHLTLAVVSDGKEEHRVVCGAPNCREGLVTAFAPVGAELTDESGEGFTVKKAKIRGVESFGMLCAEKELRIGEDADGIMELNGRAPLGSALEEQFQELVFEISLTPNLGHCSSVLGIVRELAAATKKSYTPVYSEPETSSWKTNEAATVQIDDRSLCPRYACIAIRGVKVAPSPIWMQRRLEECGIRPINNIVDVTNYVLLERGHPLHAFDLAHVDQNQIVVRVANEGEHLETLDGRNHALSKDHLVIADAKKPLALAGVMGGANSEVSDSTTDILIESALFDPVSIRKTSKEFGMQTDASKRFERGVDPNNVLPALLRAASLIQSLAGGEVSSDPIDSKDEEFNPKQVECRYDRVNHVLGTQMSESEIESVFQRLQFPFKTTESSVLVDVPTYRVDINFEIDLIEEVARIYGYDNIEREYPRYTSSPLPHSPVFLFEKRVRNRFLSEGLSEFITSDLISPTLVSLVEGEAIKKESVIAVVNPTSIEQSILRPSLLPGLMKVVKDNADQQNTNISGFEIGRVHFKDDEAFKEQSVLGVILTGKSRPHYWGEKSPEVDFYDLKGAVETGLNELGIGEFHFEKSQLESFHPGRQASIYIGDLQVGSLGEVHPALTRQIDLEQRVFYAECNLHDLLQYRPSVKQMDPLPQYPGSDRDWTMTLTEETTIRDVIGAIDQANSKLLSRAYLLDLFRSEKIGSGRKNATFRFLYRDPTKTVSQEEVDQEHARITENVLQTLGKAVV